MKIIIALIAIAFTCNIMQAQKTKTLQLSQNNIDFKCGFFDAGKLPNNFKTPKDVGLVPETEALQWMNNIVNQICEVVGLQNRYILKSVPNLDNCQAVCYNNINGQDRFIEFGMPFLKKYQDLTKNNWFVIGVAAHEIGHHLNGHSVRGYGSRPNIELEADEFAGFIMQRLGAPLQDAQAIFSFIIDNGEDNYTHPARKNRYDAIKKGWDNAAGKTTYQTLMFNKADDYYFANSKIEAAKASNNNEAKMNFINEALNDVPNYAEALSLKGLVFLDMGYTDSANIYTSNALLNDGSIPSLYYNRSLCLYKLKKYNEALETLNLILKYRPAQLYYYLLKGKIAWAQKNKLLALESLNIACSTLATTQKIEALNTRANIYLQLGQLDNYKKDIEEVKKINAELARMN